MLINTMIKEYGINWKFLFLTEKAEKEAKDEEAGIIKPEHKKVCKNFQSKTFLARECQQFTKVRCSMLTVLDGNVV